MLDELFRGQTECERGDVAVGKVVGDEGDGS